MEGRRKDEKGDFIGDQSAIPGLFVACICMCVCVHVCVYEERRERDGCTRGCTFVRACTYVGEPNPVGVRRDSLPARTPRAACTYVPA